MICSAIFMAAVSERSAGGGQVCGRPGTRAPARRSLQWTRRSINRLFVGFSDWRSPSSHAMKSSIQALRVDSAKQQLLESRMTSSTSPRQDSSNSAAGQTSQTGQTARAADAPSQPGTLTSQATQSSSEPPPSSLDRATPDHNHHNHNSSSGAHFPAITHHAAIGNNNNNSINISNLNSSSAAIGNNNSGILAGGANLHSVSLNSNNYNCHSGEHDTEIEGGRDTSDNAGGAAAGDGVHGHGGGPAAPGDSGAPLAVAMAAVTAAAATQHASPTRQLSSTAKRRRKPKIDSPNSKKICNRTEKRIDEIFKTQPNFQQQPPLQPPQPSPVPPQQLQSQQQQQQQPQQPQQPQSQQQQSQLLQQIQHSQHQSQQYQQSVRVSPYRNSCSDSSGDSIHESHPLATPPILSSSNNKVFFNTCSSLKKDSIDPCLNRDPSNFLDHNSDNLKPPSLNSSDITIHNQNDSSVISLKGRVENLEQELEERSKEIEQLKDYRRKAREVLIKTLMQQSELERRATRERVNNNKLYLGQFRSYRQGAHYEEKWTEGLKYQDLEKKRKWIEEQRDENEKRKKMWNKRKPASEKTKQSKQKGSPELEPNEFYWQAEIHDIRKLNINKEEKDLQAETERLDRERNLHIREIKRIDNEESSRFRDFPILNDRYLLLCLLGKGGFSEVYKGFDLEQLCLVACKIHELNPSWPQDKKDSYIKHALREISIHKRLEHRRIVRVHDVFNIDNDAFCTVLEHCDGNDLDFYLKQNKCIPERDAKSLVCQLVSALRYLNDRKNPIIHYDLKPGNILLCNNGEIKITDFGLSKIFPDDHHNPDGMELTSQGAGTYWYLPPECFVTENGPPTISSKVDVWSVGVIFYQALYGKKPFGNNMTQTDILHNNTILQARHISFPSFPKISDAAKEFIKRCCTYRKDLRPDVFQLCNDDYLKPKAQLKHSVDVAVLPGPSTSSSLTVPHSLTQSQSQQQQQLQQQQQSSQQITSGSNHY